MSPAQAHFNRMKDEGMDDMSAFLEAFDYATKIGLKPKLDLKGTRNEFETFTLGFNPEKKERLRIHWDFTD